MSEATNARVDRVGMFIDDGHEIQLHGWVFAGQPLGGAYLGAPEKVTVWGYSVEELREFAREARTLRCSSSR